MDDTPVRDNLEVEVTDFGPIVSAKVALRPLTVFIGPSNTGKSWLAILIYALHRFFGGGSEPGFREISRAHYMIHEGGPERFDSGTTKALVELAKEVLAEPSEPIRQQTVRLAPPIARAIRSVLDAQGKQIGASIRRSYGIDDARALIRKERRTRATVALRRASADATTRLEHKLLIEPGGTSFESSLPHGTSITLHENPSLRHALLELVRLESRSGPEIRSWYAMDAMARLMDLALPQVLGPLHEPCFYLPADRTGVMHAHSTVVSAMIESAPMTGLRPAMQAPMLTGVLADFLQQLIDLDSSPYRSKRTRRRDLGAVIEKEILGGSVNVDRSRVVGYPRFTYQPEGWQEALPLMNASSMVSELAPVVLYLRHIVGSTSVLIVEEPESHLHPAMQVEFARQLAAVVQSGVRVIVTTHSEWVLEELANTVRRSEVAGSSAKRGAAGIWLRPEDVGAWLFSPKRRPKGAVVEEIRLDEETGVFPTGYDAVSEALYNEGARIFNQIQRAKGA